MERAIHRQKLQEQRQRQEGPNFSSESSAIELIRFEKDLVNLSLFGFIEKKTNIHFESVCNLSCLLSR